MKHLTILLAAALAITACHTNNNMLNAGAYTELNDLARKNGCSDCHSIDSKVTGPAWRDVAERYKDATTYEYAYTKYSLEDGLVRKVSLGGRHDWGDPIMKQNDPGSLYQKGDRQDDIQKMVRLILKLSPGKRPSSKP